MKKIFLSVGIIIFFAVAVSSFIVGRAVYKEKKEKIAECRQYAKEAVKGDTDALITLRNIEIIREVVKKGKIDWDDLGEYDKKYLDEILDTRRPEVLTEHKRVLEDLFICRIPGSSQKKLQLFFATFEYRVKNGIFTWEELGITENEFRETKNRCLGQKI